MGHRDGIIATIALALSSVALAGIVYSDAYSQAAQSEAKGNHALMQIVLSGDAPSRTSQMAPSALLSIATVGTAQQWAE